MKLTKRKGFNFFRSYYDVYNELSDTDKVKFMDALLDRQFLGVKPTNLEGMAKFAFISQTNSIDSQVKGYEDKTGIKLSPIEAPPIGVQTPPCQPPTVGVNTPPAEQVEVEVEEKEKGKEKVEGEYQAKRLTAVITTEIPLNEVEFYEIALNIQKKIKSNLESAGGSTRKIEQANYKTWVDPIRLMMSVDGITREQINKAARFGLTDEFWKKNILSTTSFRKHFDKLILDSNGKSKNGGKTLKDDSDYIQSIADRLGVTQPVSG